MKCAAWQFNVTQTEYAKDHSLFKQWWFGPFVLVTLTPRFVKSFGFPSQPVFLWYNDIVEKLLQKDVRSGSCNVMFIMTKEML